MLAGSAFEIYEPVDLFTDSLNSIDFIIVPGVAFDNQKNRLGRGKAYYDKLLKNTKAFKAGVCFGFQLLDSVPVNSFDEKMDLVITD